jgi:hypothetical protein
VSGLVKTNSASRCRRKIEVPAPHPRAAIIDADCHASAVAHANIRAERQSPMSCGHRRAIQSLSASGLVAAKTIASAIDACDFGKRRSLDPDQHQRRNNQNAHQTNKRLHADPPCPHLPDISPNHQQMWQKFGVATERGDAELLSPRTLEQRTFAKPVCLPSASTAMPCDGSGRGLINARPCPD